MSNSKELTQEQYLRRDLISQLIDRNFVAEKRVVEVADKYVTYILKGIESSPILGSTSITVNRKCTYTKRKK